MKDGLVIKETWRLSCNILAIITDNDEVYFVSSEKKTYKTPIIRDISVSYSEMDVSEEKFRLRVNKDLDLEAFSDKLGKWLVVKNFDRRELGELITSTNNTNGVFEEEFSITFSDMDVTIARFCNPSMSSYKACVDEMTRRVNCEFYKKTRKWVGGHRYDSVTGTIYALCPALYLLTSTGRYASSETDMQSIFLYVNNIKDSEKTVSDVLKGREIGPGEDDIHFTNSLISLCDAGEVLVNDFSGNFGDYREDMILRTFSKNKIESPFFGEDIQYKVFTTMSIQSKDNISLNLNSEAQKSFEELIYWIAFRACSANWGSKGLNHCNTPENNIKFLKDSIYYFNSDFTKSNQYINYLISGMKLDLDRILEKAITNWDSENEAIYDKHDFDTYSKYAQLIQNSGNLRDYSSYSLSEMNSFFKKDYKSLHSTIISMIKEAIETDGSNIKLFRKFNTGTKKSPRLISSGEIAIDDILNYIKTRPEECENLKTELIISKFGRLYFNLQNPVDF